MADKPRISRSSWLGKPGWLCVSADKPFMGWGETPYGAYIAWLTQ